VKLSSHRQFNNSFLAVQSCSEVGDLLNAAVINPALREVAETSQAGYVLRGRSGGLTYSSPTARCLDNFVQDCSGPALLKSEGSPQDRVVAQGVEIDVAFCVWAFIIDSAHNVSIAMTPTLIPLPGFLPCGPPISEIEFERDTAIGGVPALLHKRLGGHICSTEFGAIVNAEIFFTAHAVHAQTSKIAPIGSLLLKSCGFAASYFAPDALPAFRSGETILFENLANALSRYTVDGSDFFKRGAALIEADHLGGINSDAALRERVPDVFSIPIKPDGLIAASWPAKLSAPAGKIDLTLRACESEDWHLGGLEYFGVQFMERHTGFFMHYLTAIRGNKSALNHVKYKRFADAGEVRQRANSACCSYRFLDASLCL
jgi:hypothetical protein